MHPSITLALNMYSEIAISYVGGTKELDIQRGDTLA